jgi:hypothetical protein
MVLFFYLGYETVQFLRLANYGLDVKVHWIPCECSKVYVGQS